MDSSSSADREELHSLLSGSDSGIELDEKDDHPAAAQLEHAGSSLQNNGTLKPESVDVWAREHVEVEHSLTLWQAIKSCPMAIFWCLMVSMCVVSKRN